MNGKAHTALGVGVALGACELTGLIATSADIDKVIVCAVASAAAATLPDIDVGAAKKVYRYSIYGLLATLVATVLFVFLRHGKLSSMPLSMIGLILVCGLCIFGKQQPHRGFTHSILAIVLFAIGIIFVTMNMPRAYRMVIRVSFIFSYVSHIVIDLLNKKGEQLLYPLPERYCFKVCSAKGIGNEMTAISGAFLIILFVGKLLILV